ncbi:rho GTPase-activating protein 22-like [Betta splendens]|uniref:Rho GTPase-activating protein 22-like n=1 Tax=Betta splendens TaxID=158456 RepID=A0A6P7P8S2_BETSP|nr:rho GTPase-activating protein 22-like [Betta splendens]
MGLSCFKSWKHDSTGHKGNRDVLASPGSYFFLSNSAGQGDEWLKSLNKGVWIPFTGVFGQRLEETVLYERRYGMRLIPLVVEQCVNFIRERGLHEVGLFRQPGQTSQVRELQEAFDAGERPSFDSSTDVHTVASLLKLYLRQLPEPLVPYSHYQDFLLCAQKLRSDHSLGLGELRNLLHELPVANFNLLNVICQFLNEVQSFSDSNKMSDQNLATVFGPNILRAKAEDPQSIMGGAVLVHVLMLALIRDHESLFTRIPSAISACPPGALRASPGPLRQPHLHPLPCLRQLSLPVISQSSRDAGQASTDNPSHISCAVVKADLSSGQKRRLGHRYTSSHPENCFYPLPSSSQPPQHNMTDRHPGQGPSSANFQTSTIHPQDPLPDNTKSMSMLMDWTEAWPEPGEPGTGLWSSGAAEEGASGNSSEVQEESTPSAYDNLDRVSLCQMIGDDAGGHFDICDQIETQPEEKPDVEEEAQTKESSSSWSSCEVLPLDEKNSIEEVQVRGSSSQIEEEENTENDDHEDSKYDSDHNDIDDADGVHHPNSPAACSARSGSPLSTGSSEVFLPSGPSDCQRDEAQPRDAQSLLFDLRQQMIKQKMQYQARIQRLERCNDVLERQVAMLQVSLEQQKRSQSVAEIKIRNVEQAKADADRRNTTLQREMEMFFQMYGEIKRRGEERGRGGGSL